VLRGGVVAEVVAEGFRMVVGAEIPKTVDVGLADDKRSEVEAKAGAAAGNGAGGVERGRVCLERGRGSREGDAGGRRVETGVGVRSGGGGVGRGRVSRVGRWGAAAGRAGLLGMPASAAVPPTPVWRDRIPLRARCTEFRWLLLQVYFP